MRAASQGDHPRREVDPEDRDAEGVEVGGDGAGAAAQVGDGGRGQLAGHFREGGDQGAVQRRAVGEPVGKVVRVGGGYRVVRGPGGLEEVGVSGVRGDVGGHRAHLSQDGGREPVRSPGLRRLFPDHLT